jgi:hypothetical protein
MYSFILEIVKPQTGQILLPEYILFCPRCKDILHNKGVAMKVRHIIDI